MSEQREACPVCGGRGWHTAGGNDPMECGRCRGRAEYRSVFDGYRESAEFHDWTDYETAQDEAEAFRALGCKNVRVERRPVPVQEEREEET